MAPHITELGFGCFLSPGACALPREQQIATLSALDGRLVWPQAEQLGEPSWPAFYRFLVEQQEVQQLVATKRENATIAVVSHGSFLQRSVLPCGWAHPHNVQVYAARLAILGFSSEPATPGAGVDARIEGRVVEVWAGGA